MRVQRPTTVRNDPMPPNPYVRLIAAARYCCLDDPRDGGVGVEGVDVEALSRGPKSMRELSESSCLSWLTSDASLAQAAGNCTDVT